MTKPRTGIVAGALIALVLVACLLAGTTAADAFSGQLRSRSISLTLPSVPNLGSPGGQADATLLGAMPFSDGFETGMTQWTLDGSPNWGRTTYRAASGSYSVYCVRSTVAPPGPYPNNADAFMMAGPFNLSKVGTATLAFDQWRDTEDDYDVIVAMASSDGLEFNGPAWSGDSGGWDHESLDLSAVPTGPSTTESMIGDSSVWIGFWFVSDADTRYEGVYLDNIQLLTTDPLPTGPPTISGLSPNVGSTAGGRVVTITGTNLTGATAVTFGGTPATAVTVNGLTQITATAPAHATAETVNVQVSTPLGDSANTSADDFTYLPPVIYDSYRGTDRYDTAIKLSKAMFAGALPSDSGLVLAPGETFQEALCGAPLATAYGGPVLLTYKAALANNVKAEMQRLAPKYVFCIGLSTATVTAVQTALPTATVIPLAGADVYTMSRNVAGALKTKVGDMSTAVGIVTRGDVFPDAIGVSPLACAKKWPIILTNSGGSGALQANASGAISDLGITQALKVGTYATMPAGVTGLANLSGADRYITNANVANWAKNNAGLTFTHTGLATGDKFPDALASGPFLAKDGGLLLLSPLNGPLPPPISALITANRAAVQKFTFIACVEPVIGQVKALLP